MITPGTPAIDLPRFVAPAFTASSVAMGAVVTSVTFENAAAGEPFTFGQPFKQGDIAPTDALYGRLGDAAVALQVDVKATHPDGSVRHAIVSGRLPAIGALGKMYLVRTPLTPAAAFVPPVVDAVVVLTIAGVEYTAAPSGKPIVWISGPVTTEHIYNVPFVAAGVPHAHLTAQFCVRSYEGNAKIDVTVEHTQAWTAVADIAYDVRILIGDEQRFAHAGLVHFPCTRWKETLWAGAAPALHIKHDTQYLIGTKQVPNYDLREVITEPTLVSYAKDLVNKPHGPMGNGRFAAYMPQTGGRMDIGLAPDCYAAAVMCMDKRAKDLMLASADCGGSWAAHRRDADGRMFDVLHWPWTTILGGMANNPKTGQPEKLPTLSTSSPLTIDSDHQPAFAYIPYLLTGDYFYLEELHFWCNFNLYNLNASYRNFHQGWVKPGQVRAQGWSLRTLGEAAFITPDAHCNKSTFRYFLDCNMEYYRVNYTDGPAPVPQYATGEDLMPRHNELGVITGGFSTNATIKGAAQTGMAPWMDDFFTQSVGHVAELGHPEAARLLAWKAKFPIGRMVDAGYCQTNAGIYGLRIREYGPPTIKLPGAPYYKTLKECRDGTLAGDALVCVPGDPMTGFPGAVFGFPSNLQPALAMAVDSGAPGGAEAWALFDARSPKPKYGTGPQFAIVPRTVGAALPPATPIPVPPVEPTPAPIPTPVPAPTPLPTPVPPPVAAEPVPTPVPVPAPAVPSVSLFSTRLVAGEEYVVTVTSDNGQILAVQFPVLAK